MFRKSGIICSDAVDIITERTWLIMKYSADWVNAFNWTLPPPYSSLCDRAPDEHTDVNVAILVESVDDEGENEANVAWVVIS